MRVKVLAKLEKLIKFIETKKDISIREIMKELKCSRATAYDYFNFLKKFFKVEKK